MKKIFLLICLMFVMAFLVVVFSACGGNDEGTDEYGYARPDNCWLTETFVGKANRGYFTSQKDLFTFLELKEIQTNYFGDGGKSGLLHKDTLKAIEEVEEEGYDVMAL